MSRLVGLLVVAAIAGGAATQQPPPDYGHNFIAIGDPNNPAYDNEDPFGRLIGRGSVGYEFRMSRTEITTTQWVEFVNAVDSAGGNGGAFAPFFWGGFNNGSEWVVRDGLGMRPLGGISWREAAVYCNWLHNGKPTDSLAGFQTGAYDVSTFTDVPGSNVLVNDQTTRSPGARFWIPSLDEWLKAAHYDPDKNGPGDGGWWLYNNGSDTQPVPGLPGVGETSAGVDFGDFGLEFTVPLEGYPETQSPYGLLDLSGGGTEWTEEWQFGRNESRIWQGRGAGLRTGNPNDPFFMNLDQAWVYGADKPDFGFPYNSFRIASAIPAPGVGAALVLIFLVRRRRSC